MSKKTKKEKILASYHLKLKLLQQNNNLTTQKKQIQAKEKVNENKNTVTDVDVSLHDSDANILRSYFMKDLRKSLSIIVLIIALEIIIYFASIKGYLIR